MAMITDVRHYLDAGGTLAQEMPGPAYDLALFLGAVTAWVTSPPDGRRRCSGTIHAALAPDGATRPWGRRPPAVSERK